MSCCANRTCLDWFCRRCPRGCTQKNTRRCQDSHNRGRCRTRCARKLHLDENQGRLCWWWRSDRSRKASTSLTGFGSSTQRRKATCRLLSDHILPRSRTVAPKKQWVLVHSIQVRSRELYGGFLATFKLYYLLIIIVPRLFLSVRLIKVVLENRVKRAVTCSTESHLIILFN